MVCGWCETRSGEPVTHLVQPKDRGCTDIIFLLLYIGSWVVIIGIFSSAVDKGGDPNRIIRGIDWEGHICGIDSLVKNKEYAAWPFPPIYSFKVCLTDCSETLSEAVDTTLITYAPYKSTSFLGFYCFPTFFNGTIDVDITLSGDFEDASEDASRSIGDLYTAWPVILISAVISLVFAYFYAWLCKKWAWVMVWTAIIFIIVGGFILSYVFIKKGEEYEDDAEINGEVSRRGQIVKYMGIAICIVTALFLLVVFTLRDRIRIAIAVVAEAGAAVHDVKAVILFPIWPFLAGCIFILWWIIVALYIFSVGDFVEKKIPDEIKTKPGGGNVQKFVDAVTYKEFEWNEDLKRAFAIHFFCLLWNIAFLIYFTYMVVAGTVADWYFTRRDESGNKKRGDQLDELGYHPVLDSVYRTVRFHLGTIAVGSLIIAIVQFARWVIHYLERKTKALTGEEPSILQRWLFACLKCCLWCLECCLDKINKNAFIWCAIYGDNFSTSACSSFFLIWRNLLRAAAMYVVGEYLMILGKVVVALLTTGVAALVLANYSVYDEQLNSIVMPCVAVFLLSYMVAELFMTVFETVIDTTFICFLVDEENNKRNGIAMFASEELRKIVNDHADANKKMAKRMATERNIKRHGPHGGTFDDEPTSTTGGNLATQPASDE